MGIRLPNRRPPVGFRLALLPHVPLVTPILHQSRRPVMRRAMSPSETPLHLVWLTSFMRSARILVWCRTLRVRRAAGLRPGSAGRVFGLQTALPALPQGCGGRVGGCCSFGGSGSSLQTSLPHYSYSFASLRGCGRSFVRLITSGEPLFCAARWGRGVGAPFPTRRWSVYSGLS